MHRRSQTLLQSVLKNRVQFPYAPQILHDIRNRKNNEIENLEVLCRNCHTEEHFLNGDGMLRYNYKKLDINFISPNQIV